MDLSFEFRNNFVFRCAVFFVVLKYVIGLIRVDFDSNNQMGEGDTPKRPMIVSTVGTNLELFWLFFFSSSSICDYNFCTYLQTHR